MALERERFGADELAICLSHYDLGVIESIREFPRGSRRSPKVVLDTRKGRFLLKRRMRGREDARRVAATHDLQLFLAGQGFPLPHLVGTRGDDNSLLVHDGAIYEMFEFIEGVGYDGSLEATHSAGRTLGLFHKLVTDYRPNWDLPTGTYHDARAIRQAIRNTGGSMPDESRPPSSVLSETVEELEARYDACAAAADRRGLAGWERQMVHGDWHPGNMLFRDRHVVAVIDYDTAKLQPRILDVANGALQFSITGGGDDPRTWPDYLDESRYKRFLRGYDSVNVLSVAELKVVPYLMCEAMIAEAVLPIAATGSFGRVEGFPVLQMVRRKVRWILENRKLLAGVLQD